MDSAQRDQEITYLVRLRQAQKALMNYLMSKEAKEEGRQCMAAELLGANKVHWNKIRTRLLDEYRGNLEFVRTYKKCKKTLPRPFVSWMEQMLAQFEVK